MSVFSALFLYYSSLQAKYTLGSILHSWHGVQYYQTGLGSVHAGAPESKLLGGFGVTSDTLQLERF